MVHPSARAALVGSQPAGDGGLRSGHRHRHHAGAALALDAKDSLEPFEDFLVQYRADPAFQAHPTPLISAANVLLKLGGPQERAQLLFVAEHPATLEAVATHIKRSLAQPAPGEKSEAPPAKPGN